MKKLITILLIVSGLAAKAQYPTPPFLPINSSYGSPFLRGKFDSALYIPTGCGTPTDTTWLFSQGTRPGFIGMGQKYRNGALYWDSCAHKLYGHDGIGAWFQVGGSGGTFDTTTIYRILGTKADTASFNTLIALVNGKMTNFGGAPGMAIGSLSARPAASTLQTGTVYIAADSGFQYVDTGSGGTAGWKKISGGSSGASAITQLTGDVTAGPGSGSQADTVKGILNHVVPSLSVGYLQWTGSAFSWTTPSGGGADSAIWKNNGTYTGNHTLTMGSHTQTVSGNKWLFDSLSAGVTHAPFSDTIIWFGDSYFAGYGASSVGNDMVSLTDLKLRANTLNHGVFGQLGQTGMTLYIDSIPVYDSTKYRGMLSNWGTNDLYQVAGGTPGIDTTDFKDSVGRFIDTAIARGWPARKIFFLSIINIGTAAGPNSVYHANYFSAQKNLCAAKGIVFIDMMTPFQQIAGTPFLSGLMFDALHPNDRGHEVYSTVISSVIGYHTVAQAQAVAVNGLIEANNITARALPYANVKSTLVGVDTAGRLVQFNQEAYIPNSLDTIYSGNINIAGDATFGGEIAGTALAISGTDATVPHNCSKCLLMQFNPGTNTGTVDALNFFGAAYNISFNSIFGGGTVMIYEGAPFDATDGFENGGKTYLNGSLRMNSTALATGTTTDSVIVVTTTANVATYKKVAQSSIGGRTSIRFSPRDSAGLTIGFYLDSAGVHVDSVSFDAISSGGGIDSVTLADTAAAIRTVIANANIYTGQGTKLYGADTIAFGGTLTLPDTLATAGHPLLITGLPSVATPISTDSVVGEHINGQLFKAPVPSGGGGTPANPTASAGLSAVNGTATTYMRSDAAPLISQSIAPTWSGTHIFSSAIKVPGVTAGSLSNTGLKVLVEDTTSGGAGQVYSLPFYTTDSTGYTSGDTLVVMRAGKLGVTPGQPVTSGTQSFAGAKTLTTSLKVDPGTGYLQVTSTGTFMENAVWYFEASTSVNYTVGATDYFINVPAGSSALTVTMPSTGGLGGRVLIIRNESSNAVTLAGTTVKGPTGSTVTTVASGTSIKVLYESIEAAWVIF